MIKKIIKTVFPKFKGDQYKIKGQLPSAPFLECEDETSFSPADASDVDFVTRFNRKEAAYRKKEDEDVAMFLSLVDRMSVKSLLFILQGHARSMHNIPEGELRRTLRMINNEKKEAELESSNHNGVEAPLSPKARRKTLSKANKKCRFMEIMGGQRVREVVHEIPHCFDFSDELKSDIWWSDEELTDMKREAAKVVNFFKDHRPEYAQSVEVLAESVQVKHDSILVEYHMKKLSQNSFPRGLECHIVPCIQDFRRDGREAVLAIQDRYRLRRLSAQTPPMISAASPRLGRGRKQMEQAKQQQLEELKEQEAREAPLDEQIRASYRKASSCSRTLARKMAECDHIEALKASISRWSSEPAKPGRSLPPRNPSLTRKRGPAVDTAPIAVPPPPPVVCE